MNELNKHVVHVLTFPEIRERLASQGAESVGNSPAELGAFVRSEIAKWRKVIQAARIVPD